MMMPLRAFARAAPLRTASRLTTKTTSTLLRSAVQSSVRSTFLAFPIRGAIASFSTTRFRCDEYSQQLALKLANEIELEAEEAAASAGSDAGVKQYFDEVPGWEVIDKEGEHDVFLQKTYDDEEVTVHFTIADFNNNYPEENMEDDFLAEEADMDGQSGGAQSKGRTGNPPADRDELIDAEDDMSSPAFPSNVTVLIRRPANAEKGSLRFDLLAEEGTFSIQQLTHLPPSTASAAEQIREAYAGRQNEYSGPPFEQLDENLQSNLEEYLNARGIADDLATFIPNYIDVKEQKEYQAWLHRVKNFVE